MNKKIKIFFIVLISSVLLQTTSAESSGLSMADYTAYPAFATNAVAPNILLVLDHSGSMAFPAYIGCNWGGYSGQVALCGESDTGNDPDFNYNSTRDYYGYFRTDKYYQYGTNKFLENAACSYSEGSAEYKIGSGTSCISGNLLNWASMSRIDILRKVLIGGKSVSSQDNAHTLRAEGGRRTFTDENLECKIEITGGSYPNFSHDLTISDAGAGGATGTCNNLSVWANGTTMWGRRDRFRYVYQYVSGDFDAKLLITSPPDTAASAKAGLVVRKGTNSRHQHVKAMATRDSGLQFSYRSSYNGDTYMIGNYVPWDYDAGADGPVWVRITRSGDTFTFYYSTPARIAADSTDWDTHGSQYVDLPSTSLIGMGVSSYLSNTLGKGDFDEFICSNCSDDDFEDESFNTSIWNAMDIYTQKPGNQVEACSTSSTGCPVGPLTTANLSVDIPSSTKSGVIQALSDTDGDGNWDDGAPRFGLMIYNSDYKGCMKTGIKGSNMSSFLTALQDEPAYNGTPTGEALNEAWDYYIQSDVHSGCNNSAYVQGPGSSKDPWYDGDPVSCRDSFVLLISDGEWNGSVDPVKPARDSHVDDIRPDIDGTQVLSHFSVYSFGYDTAGENSMQQIGMYGGFDDYDGNKWPYDRSDYPADSRTATLPASPCDPDALPMSDECKEWDTNEDGLPDTYYQASEGDQLETSLIQAISDILRRSSSGTAVSVLATTGEGEGAIYQAYFLPEKLEGIEPRKWLGYVQALFVDKYGNLREDTNDNDTLDMASDYIIEMGFDTDLGSIVDKYADADGNGEKDTPDSPVSTVSLDDISALWKGGNQLWSRDAADRTIFTTLDGYTSIDFTTTNAADLQNDLRAFDVTEAANIINWVRGNDLAGTIDSSHDEGYRKRDLTIDEINNVWKLGDIIHSTPTIVSKAVENYDLLYGDLEYANYRSTHLSRRMVLYAGSNAGMLHAFNAGCFNSTEKKFYSSVNSSGTCVDDSSEPLGHELWAFIPHNIMPHLKWNTMPGYTHVYDVDLKPKVTDIKVFEPDDMHASGYGTILISGLGYGGKDIQWCSLNPDVLCTQDSNCSAVGAGTCTGGSASPEYYALDITDPAAPRILWSFTNADLGLTMSNPSIAKIGNTWYAIFGSGATDFDTGADLTAFQAGTLFVLDLSSGTDGVISVWTLNDNYWKISTGNTTSFITDPINVDVDMDFDTDVIYVGENYQQTNNSWNALMQRITTNSGANEPSAWDLSTLANVGTLSNNNDKSLKITSAPSVAMDDNANLFVYFGTGQYYGSSDNNQIDTGGFYALKDSCWNGSCDTAVTSILDVSASSVDTSGDVVVSGSCGGSVSTWPDLLTASYTCGGWAIYFEDLTEQVDFTGAALSHDGERVLGKPLVLGGLVLWTTFIPGSDICANIGESNIYAVYYATGTSYNEYVFSEQAEQENPSSTVARVKRLGSGMPSSISAQITSGGTAMGFVQQSTGSILEIESITPLSITSDVTGWKNEKIE